MSPAAGLSGAVTPGRIPCVSAPSPVPCAAWPVPSAPSGHGGWGSGVAPTLGCSPKSRVPDVTSRERLEQERPSPTSLLLESVGVGLLLLVPPGSHQTLPPGWSDGRFPPALVTLRAPGRSPGDRTAELPAGSSGGRDPPGPGCGGAWNTRPQALQETRGHSQSRAMVTDRRKLLCVESPYVPRAPCLRTQLCPQSPEQTGSLRLTPHHTRWSGCALTACPSLCNSHFNDQTPRYLHS